MSQTDTERDSNKLVIEFPCFPLDTQENKEILQRKIWETKILKTEIWKDRKWHITLTVSRSTSSRNLRLTEINASSGHSWNQSMQVQFVTAGNRLLRTRKVFPTGEKQRMTW